MVINLSGFEESGKYESVGLFGIPKEPYAFSNKAKPFMESPKWSKVALRLSGQKK